MWIRSQDKKRLIKCDSLCSYNDVEGKNCIVEEHKYSQAGTSGIYYILGYYSEKRCIEILDEVEKFIEKQDFRMDFDKVYQMPLK